ncbi:MAG: Ig-like domain-containing protein, partial [Bifidobacteriaceae bacterium]|jgi:hypothetical protein|nr:Ig-like domain-containing protein [Bifidobacteriaceae bacterium]
VVFHLPAGLAGVCAPNQPPRLGPAELPAHTVDGAASCRLTSRGAGGYWVSADLKEASGAADRPILAVRDDGSDTNARQDGKVALTFVAGHPSGVESELTIPTAGTTKPVGGSDKHTAAVLVRDVHGNPVAGVPVTFQWTAGGPDGPGSGLWTTAEAGRSGADGRAAISFSAPDNRAGWIWVKAFIEVSGARAAVGRPQLDPAYGQSLKGAEFVAAGVDGEKTAASFETFVPAVLNNLVDRSWAAVRIQDAYGNGVPGVDVTFTLPDSQTGTAGTPVFADGSAAPSAKTITVSSCAADLRDVEVPEACRRAGVYTPGLAYVPIVSDFEGVFAVSATAQVGSLTIQMGPGDVTFAAGPGSAEASTFSLVKTDPDQAVVAADGVQSYTLTTTVFNGLTGQDREPVAGQCVTPQLAPGVVAAGSGGDCPAGSFVTDSAGRAVVKITSAVAGWSGIGVRLGGSPVPATGGTSGDEYGRSVLFVGGTPAGPRSELTSPPAPVRADDPSGQSVTATLRDQAGNLASCWDGSRQVACQARLTVPKGTWVVGDNQIAGPAVVQADASLVDYGSAPSPGQGGVFQPPSAGATVSVTYRGEAGQYRINGQTGGHDIMLADSIAAGDDPAAAIITFTDSTAPEPPSPKPSDGGQITGLVAPADRSDAAAGGWSVIIKDQAGVVLSTCPVDRNGAFTCLLSPKLAAGTIVTVAAVDAAGNQTGVDWRVGLPKLTLASPTLCGGADQAVSALNFQPGEEITAVTSDGAHLGKRAADQAGAVQFSWTTPAGLANGAQTVSLSGPLSGEYRIRYLADCPLPPPPAWPSPPSGSPSVPVQSVPPPRPGAILPFTGMGGLGLGLVAAGLIAAGVAALATLRRRLQRVPR